MESFATTFQVDTVLVLKTFTFLSYPILNPTSSILHTASYIQHFISSILHTILFNLSYPILSYPTKIFKIILVETKLQWSPTIILYVSWVIYATKREFTVIKVRVLFHNSDFLFWFEKGKRVISSFHFQFENENQKIGSFFWFSFIIWNWKSENWTYFLIFILQIL